MKHALLVGAFAVCATPVLRAQEVDFNREVRPILSDKCYHCHGPDEQNRKANLRLDTAEGAARVVAGERPEATKLYERITSTKPSKRMPPAEANFAKELNPQEIAVLKRWLGSGAKYSKHWAFEPPAQPKLPDSVDAAWTQPIDRLIAARLRQAKLKPSPRADRATLLRRVTLDLTGLPPTPQELDAFLKDESPRAYEKVVDRLLASPRYGERMALFWMDLARYGDSSVYHADGNRDMWAWRDGVIRAFNDNQPFDQFTLEQLAGDLLPNATLDQKVASGFNRNHATTDEGGVIAEEFRVDYVVDRVKTVSNTWLALSLECGQCHDHKYDPVSQREYYQFYAYFNNTKDGGMQTRGGNAAPKVSVPDREAALLLKDAQLARQAAEAALQKLRRAKKDGEEFREWLSQQASTAPPLPAPDFYLPLDEKDKSTVVCSAAGQVVTAPAALAEAKRPTGGGLKFDGKTSLAFNDTLLLDSPWTLAVWVQVPVKGGGPILSGLAASQDFQFSVDDLAPAVSIGRTTYVSQTKLKAAQWHHVVFSGQGSKDAAVQIFVDGNQAEVQAQPFTGKASAASAAAKAGQLLLAEGRAKAKFLGDLDNLCFYRRGLTEAQVPHAAGDPVASILAAPRSPAGDAVLFDHYLRTGGTGYSKSLRELNQAIDEERRLASGATSVMVMEELPQMRPTYILNRGQYDQPLKDKLVKPGVPAVLPALPEDAPPNRLGLARWLVQPDHPLTSRVAMNRFWQLLFGEGLVRTSEDFGLQGEMPSHPELLDWLAVDFTRSGWDVKRAIKQMVMSETYCQQSKLTPALRDADPENRLLGRAPRLRLQGEFIRDSALFVSGLLVEKLGGRSVKPYQPPGVWEEVTLSGERYVPERGERNYRRSMYTYWKRSAPHPAMLTFDAPTREKCTGARPRTNTPLQALVTLNDPQFVEAARAFAQRIIQQGGAAPGERLEFASLHALGRAPTAHERGLLEKLLASQRARFEAQPAKAEALLRIGESPRDTTIAPAEQAAWTVVASTLLNLDEFLVKN